jgi:cytochrome c2
MTKYVYFALALIAFVLIGIPAFAGNCQALFHHRQVHHAQALVLAQPLYFAGQSTQDEALVRKVVREELRQALQAQPQQQQATASGAFAKCSKCHKGETALTSDPATFKAFARMAGLGEGIPNEMKAVIGALTPSEKGELTEYLLRLPAARIEPQVTIPPPEQSGILR